MSNVAVVTGGTAGIGLATARRLLERGDTVVITGRNSERGRKALADLNEPGRVNYIQADATSVADTERVMRETVEAHGRIDALVTNQGSMLHIGTLVEDLPDDALAEAFHLNCVSHFYAARAALRYMLPRGRGRITFVSSAMGKEGFPALSCYVTAKHALLGFAKTLAAEVSTRGITVNAVCPGLTDTDMIETARPIAEQQGLSLDQLFDGLLQQKTNIGRLLDPAEVAATIAFLSSPDAVGMSGACVSVDAGFTDY